MSFLRNPLNALFSAASSYLPGTLGQRMKDSALFEIDQIINPANNPLAAIIKARHARLAALITDCKAGGTPIEIKGGLIGNSIAAGSSASTFGLNYSWRIGELMQAWTGTGTSGGWSLLNCGIGGQNIYSCLPYLADNGDSGPIPTRATIFNTCEYIVLMELRNSANVVPLGSYAEMLSLAIRQTKRAGKDFIFVSEPPKLDAGGNIIDTDANFTPWLKIAKKICAEEGASFVDTWQFMSNLKRNGVSLLPYMNADGVHPNDAGHELIAQLLKVCITSPVESIAAWNTSRAVRVSRNYLVSKYNASAGATSIINNVSTANTSRQLQLGEANKSAYVLTNGQSLTFGSPAPTNGLLMITLGGPANPGTASSTYAYVATSGLTSENIYTRESASFTSWTKNAANIGNAKSVCIITCNSAASVAVTGVIFLCADTTENQPTPRNSVEVGAWADSTLTTGSAARQSSTVGNTKTIEWYGETLAFDYKRSDSSGKFTISTDGGAPVTVDCYQNAPPFNSNIVAASGLNEGPHTTTITVIAANASAVGSVVCFGNLFMWTQEPMPDYRFLTLSVGDTVPLRGAWKKARIERILSGAPGVEKWLPGSASLALTGTGAAIVRLER